MASNKENFRTISDLVNNTAFQPLEVGVLLSTDHRYLQQQFFNMFVGFISMLSHNYKEGHYDGRNERACKFANAMMEAYMKEIGVTDEKSLSLGYPKYCKNHYEAVLLNK